MEDHNKKKKSPHLQELEEVFEQRMRRFSAFEILGLTPEGGQKPPEAQAALSRPSESAPVFGEATSGADEHSHELDRRSDGLNTPMGVSDTPMGGSITHIHERARLETPTHGSNTPMGGPAESTYVSLESSTTSALTSTAMDRPSQVSGTPFPESDRPTPGIAPAQDRVVVVNKTTTAEKPIPGAGIDDTPTGYPNGPSRSSQKPIDVSQRHAYGSDKPSSAPDTDSRAGRGGRLIVGQVTQLRGLPFADVVTAMQLGSQLGNKAGKVLAYLNIMRAPNHESYTIPVGYGQISGAAGVDAHYLRRKVLPKLAMLGLIGVARKSLDGTIYHFPHGVDYVRVVTGELTVEQAGTVDDEAVDIPE